MDNSSSASNLHQQAIDAALDTRWEEALKINKQILKLDPENIDALNRQARAYMEIGNPNVAKKYYSKVLKFDPYNPIALKNLKIMKSCKPKRNVALFNGQGLASYGTSRLSASLFLQEPGKTKIVNLLKVAEPQKLSHAFCGMKVTMVIKNRKITIVDLDGNYLGVLPDDISHHLMRLFKGGNKYELFITSVRVNSLSIIIKETFRSKRFKNQPSFLGYSIGTPGDLMRLNGSNMEKDNEIVEEEQEI